VGDTGEITLIVNPAANRGRSEERVRRAECAFRRCGARCRTVRTESYETIEHEARRARERGAKAVVACGGDGTNRAVATAVAGTDTPMGILPCGRGNDLARALGLPFEPEPAANTIFAGSTRRIDLGFAEGQYFTTAATLGIDSAVSERVRASARGALAGLSYPFALVATLLTFRFPHVVLDGDFGRREGPILLAATANTPWYGRGMRIAPPAAPDDGLFHLCVIRALSKVKLLALFPTVYRGAHLRFREVELLSTRRLSVSSERPLSLYADGELLGKTPINLEIRPRALSVCVPCPPSASAD